MSISLDRTAALVVTSASFGLIRAASPLGALRAHSSDEPVGYGQSVTRQLLPPEEEAALISLWSSRADLGKPQWEQLWTLVTRVLSQCNPLVLRQLPDSKDDYITEFFLHKVVQEKFGSSRLDSAAALATFFQRYLIDVQRFHARRPTVYLDDEQALDAFRDGEDEVSCEDIQFERGTPLEDAHRGELLDAAVAFFEELPQDDQLYLSLHACDEEGEPLYKLASRYAIASYHYKAGQLGITRKKGELPEGYERTRIGAWLTGKLGLRVSPEFADEILEAFRALCEAALALRERLLARVEHA